MTSISRRTLIAALAGGSLAIGSSRKASAFSNVPSADAGHLLALRDTACGATNSHQQLVDEVNRVLGDQYTPEQKKDVVASMTCPVCGCPLSALF